METTLLIIKNRDQYIRVRGDDYQVCNLDKASVFPMEKLELVKRHIESMKQTGFEQPVMAKLILREESF
jgi:hypothetical protein